MPASVVTELTPSELSSVGTPEVIARRLAECSRAQGAATNPPPAVSLGGISTSASGAALLPADPGSERVHSRRSVPLPALCTAPRSAGQHVARVHRLPAALHMVESRARTASDAAGQVLEVAPGQAGCHRRQQRLQNYLPAAGMTADEISVCFSLPGSVIRRRKYLQRMPIRTEPTVVRFQANTESRRLRLHEVGRGLVSPG